MREKAASLISDLSDSAQKVQDAFNGGVVSGFTKEQEPYTFFCAPKLKLMFSFVLMTEGGEPHERTARRSQQEASCLISLAFLSANSCSFPSIDNFGHSSGFSTVPVLLHKLTSVFGDTGQWKLWASRAV